MLVFRVADILAMQAEMEVQEASRAEAADLRELNKTTEEDARCAWQQSLSCSTPLLVFPAHSPLLVFHSQIRLPRVPGRLSIAQLPLRAHREEAASEARAAAAFKRTTEAKARVSTFKRLRLEPTSQSGLPVECWALVLSKCIDPKLWNLGFMRDICNAGMPHPRALFPRQSADLTSGRLCRHGEQDLGPGSQADVPAGGGAAGSALPRHLQEARGS